MKDKAQVSKKNTLTKTVQTTVAALASTVLLGVGNAQAALLIDDFLDFQSVESNGPLTNSQVGPTVNILGGYRDIFVEIVEKRRDNELLGSGIFVDNGEASFNNDAYVTGAGRIRWDGNNDSETLNPLGLGGIDITGGNLLDSLFMDVIFADLGLNMTFTIYDMDSNSSSISRTLNSNISTSQEEAFLFTDFVGTADFTNVGAIELGISGPESMDAVIGSVRMSRSTPIPEPTSILGLLAIGAVGTGSMLKQKKNN